MKNIKRSNIFIIAIVLLLLIPQTRKPIQVFLNKGIALVVKPSPIDDSKRKTLTNYHWKLKSVEGETFNLDSVKGKVIVVNFWATWCPPCIAEMPSLEALYRNYASNDDVVFLFVSNEDSNKLYEFMVHNNYSFPVYKPLTQYPSEFNVSSIPRTFVIGKTGDIVIDKSGAADWDSDVVKSTIESLLTES